MLLHRPTTARPPMWCRSRHPFVRGAHARPYPLRFTARHPGEADGRSFTGTDFCVIFAPSEGYDEPEILPSSIHPICLMSADGGSPRNSNQGASHSLRLGDMDGSDPVS